MEPRAASGVLTVASPQRGSANELALVEATSRGICVVKATPLTGRTHQIRVHLAHSGHPIFGDVLYGPPAPWNPMDTLEDMDKALEVRGTRHALHAHCLRLTNVGLRGEQLTVTAPLPGDMLELLRGLGLEEGYLAGLDEDDSM
eukprot:gene19594-biopygen20220